LWGLRLFTLRLCKPHLDCLVTTIAPLYDFKLYLLPFYE